MKNTLKVISWVLVFLLAGTQAAISGQVERSSNSSKGYQAVKPYVPEDQTGGKEDKRNDQLSGDEAKAVQTTTALSRDMMEVQNAAFSESLYNQAERSAKVSNMQEKSEAARVELSASLKNAAAHTNNQAAEPVEPGQKQQAENSTKRPANDGLTGFLASHDGALSPATEGNPTAEARKEDTSVEKPASLLPVNLAVTIVESVSFTAKFRAIYELMNPPEHLHPWLKWLLYSSRLNQDMIAFYYQTLKKRDEIYQKALNGNGQFAVYYKDKVFKNIPFYVMPEWANGDYALVMLRYDSAIGKELSAIHPG